MIFFRLPQSVGMCLLAAVLVPGCAVVETGASVAKATAGVASATVSVASATVSVASAVVGTTVAAGGAAVAAGSAAKSVTVAAVSTAVAAGSLVVVGAQALHAASRENDVATASVIATAPDRFRGADGRSWITQNCSHVPVGQPALWVAMRSGEHEVRVNSGTRCAVTSLE